ncbi:hypothetical protein BG011_007178 [Mortierella polycephala]|uniref:Uncharacterized protein n=1 Tax=Mortierella polycephala TaxID=41804 RepID=A0A9P6PT46_9FUNG|nr:hypothetical protein BG011_007178 [Mortierella polycephala]
MPTVTTMAAFGPALRTLLVPVPTRPASNMVPKTPISPSGIRPMRSSLTNNYAVINRRLDLMRAQSLNASFAAPLLKSTVTDQQEKINQLTNETAITRQNAVDNYAVINRRLDLIEAPPAAPLLESTVADQQEKINRLTEETATMQQNAVDNYAIINRRLDLIEAQPAAPVNQPRASVPASSTQIENPRRLLKPFV